MTYFLSLTLLIRFHLRWKVASQKHRRATKTPRSHRFRCSYSSTLTCRLNQRQNESEDEVTNTATELAELDDDLSHSIKDEDEVIEYAIQEEELLESEDSIFAEEPGHEMPETEESVCQESNGEALSLDDEETTNESNVEDSSLEETDTVDSTVETINPFEETFEEEEHLVDRFGPYVAFQNQSSLSITSEELTAIKLDDIDSELEQVASHQVSHGDDDSIEVNLESEVDSDNAVESYHEHITEATSNEIQDQAEKILGRLNTPVSHETDVTDNSEPEPEPEEPDALSETQDILNEILEEKRKIAAAHDEKFAADNAIDTLQMEHSLADPDQPGGVDDREMIIVNRMDEQQSVASPVEPQEVPFPKTPVSTGRAERMDYQKLFDQLRDQAGNP